MARPKNVDNILLALKAKLMEFDREHGITRGAVPPYFETAPVLRFIEDLKGIFFVNSKLVAPFYLDAIKQLEEDLSYVKPSQFNRLTTDANLRAGNDEPPSVKRAREMAQERRRGIFRCLKCNEILDVDSHAVMWDSQGEGYIHTVECKELLNVDNLSSETKAN